MPNSIAFAQNYTGILDEVYQRASVSGCLNSGRRLVRASQNAREIKIPMISVTCLGDYTRNVGYRDGSITMTYETKSPNYDSNNALSRIRPRLTSAVSCVRERAAAS